MKRRRFLQSAIASSFAFAPWTGAGAAGEKCTSSRTLFFRDTTGAVVCARIHHLRHDGTSGRHCRGPGG